MTISEIISGFIEANKNYYRKLKKSKAIHQHKGIPSDKIYQKVHENAAPIFVLSTGRSGTMFLTNILKQSSSIHVEHEPEIELNFYSKYAYENQNKPEELEKIIDACRYEPIRDCFLANQIYVETNNRITFFAPQLAKLYPNAKFIHLIRKPEAFIKSGVNRSWYKGTHLHDEGRITHPNPSLWDTYSQEEKVAWLWNETNQFIEDFKGSISSERQLTLSSHQLFKSKTAQKNVVKFIGLSNFKFKPVKPANKQKKKSNAHLDTSNISEILTLKNQYDY